MAARGALWFLPLSLLVLSGCIVTPPDPMTDGESTVDAPSGSGSGAAYSAPWRPSECDPRADNGVHGGLEWGAPFDRGNDALHVALPALFGVTEQEVRAQMDEERHFNGFDSKIVTVRNGTGGGDPFHPKDPYFRASGYESLARHQDQFAWSWPTSHDDTKELGERLRSTFFPEAEDQIAIGPNFGTSETFSVSLKHELISGTEPREVATLAFRPAFDDVYSMKITLRPRWVLPDDAVREIDDDALANTVTYLRCVHERDQPSHDPYAYDEADDEGLVVYDGRLAHQVEVGYDTHIDGHCGSGGSTHVFVDAYTGAILGDSPASYCM